MSQANGNGQRRSVARIDCMPHAPSDWTKCGFRDVADVNPIYKLNGDGVYPFAEMAAVAENFAGIKEFAPRAFQSGFCRFRQNDTIFAKITPCAEHGKVAFVENVPGEFGTGSTEFIVLSPKAGIDPRFLFYLATCPAVHRLAVSRMEGSTGRLRVSEATFTKWLSVAVPPPEEQTRIAVTLKAADDYIRALDDQLRKAERVKMAQLQYYYVAEPHRKTEIPQAKPWHTTIVKLGRCGQVATGGTPDRTNKDLYGGMIPWVKSGEVLFNTIADTEEKLTPGGAASINGDLYPRGSVIIALYGAGQTCGRAAILGIPAYINQALAAIICDEATVNEWLFYWFQRNYERVRSFAGGSSQDNLNLSLLKDMDVSRPDITKQKEIVARIKATDDLIASLNAQDRAARRVKQSLLQNLLTGRIRLKP